MAICNDKKTRVIINADDYGLNPAVSRAIRETIEAGTVTSISILTNFDDFSREIKRIKDCDISCGIHLNLTEGKPLTFDSNLVPLLSSQGNFRSYFHLGKVYMGGKLPLAGIVGEFRKQIEALSQQNVRIDHIDSHQNIHLLPPIAKVVIDLAREYGIKWIRLPLEKYATLNTDPKGFVKKTILLNYCRSLRKTLRQSRVNFIDGYFGLSGLFTDRHLDEWCRFLGSLRSGTYELCVHPGLESPTCPDPISEFRVRSYQALMSQQFKDVMQANSMISFGKFPQ